MFKYNDCHRATGWIVGWILIGFLAGACSTSLHIDSLKKEKSQLEKVNVSLDFEVQNLRQEVLMKANRIEELERKIYDR